MDRRQQKTREAIFTAFAGLLEKRSYHRVSVQDILDAANVGRTTFYAHFETKDYLLRALCEELFRHIIDSAKGLPDDCYHWRCTQSDGSVWLHLFRHLQDNDWNIIGLLLSDNNALFLGYFKENVKDLITAQYADSGALSRGTLPQDYLVNHLAATFVETVSFWVSRGMSETPEQITEYYLRAVEPLL